MFEKGLVVWTEFAQEVRLHRRNLKQILFLNPAPSENIYAVNLKKTLRTHKSVLAFVFASHLDNIRFTIIHRIFVGVCELTLDIVIILLLQIILLLNCVVYLHVLG